MNSSDRVLSVRLPSKLIDEIDKIAKKKNVSRSVIVREALEKFFSGEGNFSTSSSHFEKGETKSAVIDNSFLEEMGWD